MTNPPATSDGSTTSESHARIEALIQNIETVVYGKREVIQLCLVGLFARGHLLIEDIPGIGKTTLAQALALSIKSTFHRVQFTSDMLPADILGVSIISPSTRDFEFREGPIFANIMLADEVNRTPPKTQSALLEAMSEFHVTADGVTRPLPKPFMVLATQNPIEYEGTYSLPEAQLDRFLLRVSIGYPAGEDELRIMRRHDPQPLLEAIEPTLTVEDIVGMQAQCQQVQVEDTVADYILAIVHATREHADIKLGASPRASLAFYEACQAWAFVQGRDYVTPGDVKHMAIPVMGHRIIAKSHSGNRVATTLEREMVLQEILSTLTVPV